jgi:hypothetical protein
MPSYSEVVSTLALFISCGSLLVAALVAGRDRPRLKITAHFIPASEYGPNRVQLKLVNLGRRPVILRLLGGTSKDGKWSATFLEREKGGLRLGEHEMYEYTIDKEDTVSFHHEHDDLFYDRLWVEDSLGRRHKVPASQALIKKLWQ